MSDHDREVLAGMLQSSFEGGIHDTLVTLHDAEVEPFDSGYEGSPFHDFVGRLTGWQRPEGDPGPEGGHLTGGTVGGHRYRRPL